MKYFELIGDSNLLLALVILIIIVFLAVCCLVFYNAFYPDGIPEHLKEDKESEKSEKSQKDDMEETPMMMDAQADANGNGTQVEGKQM